MNSHIKWIEEIAAKLTESQSDGYSQVLRICDAMRDSSDNTDEKRYFELKCSQQGLLVDGRHYCILSISSIVMYSDGSYECGDIEVGIDNVRYKMRISEFVKNIKTIGSLDVR